jgi:hypothetical protein
LELYDSLVHKADTVRSSSKVFRYGHWVYCQYTVDRLGKGSQEVEQSQHARLSVFFLMSLFLAKFCVSFHRHAPSRIFPQSCRLMWSRSSAALQAYVGFISTHGKKENMEHMLWRKLEVCLFLLDRLIGLGWFG